MDFINLQRVSRPLLPEGGYRSEICEPLAVDKTAEGFFCVCIVFIEKTV